MKEYEVTAHYSEVIRVSANNEIEAIHKAQEQLKNINTTPIADDYDVEEIEE